MTNKPAKKSVGHLAKLTAAQVRKARKQYESGKKGAREIAIQLGVSITAISFMLNGKTYKHVK